MSEAVMLKNVRIMFIDNLFKPASYKGSAIRHSATFMVEKKSANAKSLFAAMERAAEQAWPGKGKAMLEKFKSSPAQYCVKDGDDPEAHENNAGHWIVTAHRNAKQGLPDFRNREMKVVGDDGTIFAGCYVNADVDMWGQTDDHPGARCTLIGVQYVGDGERFGGGRSKGAFTALDTEDDDTDM